MGRQKWSVVGHGGLQDVTGNSLNHPEGCNESQSSYFVTMGNKITEMIVRGPNRSKRVGESAR